MPTPLRRRLRMARRGAFYGVAIVLVLVALVLAAASQALPLAERHPERVAQWLSERAGRPVAFDRVQTRWTRRGPLLRLDGLRVGEGAQAFTIGDAEMLVSVYAGLLPGQSFSELRLRGLDLTLERGSDGRWQVRGLPGPEQAAQRDPFAALEGLGELQVIDGKLAVIAPELGVDARLPRIDLRLRVDGARVRAGVRAWPSRGAEAARASTAPLDAVLDFDRKRGDGRAYAGATRADLAGWSPLLRFAGVRVESGQGRAQAWAELRGHRIAAVTLATALQGVGLRAEGPRPAPAGAKPAPAATARFEQVQAHASWRLTDSGWRLDAPILRFAQGGQTQALDGLAAAGGAHYALRAPRIDAGPLAQVAALSDAVPERLRHWLETSHPRASLSRIAIDATPDGPVRVSARVDGFGFDPVGASPGLHGLSGDFQADAEGFAFDLDPARPMRWDWPAGFGVAHTVNLHGRIGGWRVGAGGWRVATSALRLQGPDFGLSARGGMTWEGDGGRPRIDLAADLDATQVPVAKGFWVRHRMSPRLVEWLDAALVGGRLQNAHAVVSGDLDDWPFIHNNGLFEASAQLRGATVKFQPEWPAVEGLDADVRFLGDGFRIEGVGRMAGIGVRRVVAGIDHYKGGSLSVRAEAGADAAQLLALLKQSPLRKEHAETFDNLRASGPAEVGFGMDLPLRPGAPAEISGTVELRGAKLADPRWNVAFEQVAGRAEYGRGGFRAEDLAVLHEGAPGRLSLRAGESFVRERGHVFEVGLDATASASDLIERGPDELAWLKPYFDGRSPWTISVSIPKSAPGAAAGPAPAMLRLQSSLAGTAIGLPPPLDKAAASSLPATVETPLPLGSGEVRVNLSDTLALRARNAQGKTGVRVVLGASRVDEAPPASGLVVTGRADRFEAIDWVAIAHGGEGAADGIALQRVDVTARRLQLLGGVFPDTRVIVAPAAQGATAVRTEGAALAGAVMIPGGQGGTIAGRFARVHWRAPDAPPAPAPGRLPAPPPGSPLVAGAPPRVAADRDTMDPAKVPALNLDIGELRIGEAALGSASLRTRPTPAGMRIDRFSTRTDKQSLELSGDWTGRGATARTHLSLALDTRDVGALLEGFGFGGQIGGGKGKARFEAGWPGSPAAFALGSLEGSLDLDVRDGRLIEVEPGAGRVLGLLSVAQLPRRLTLDFRDLFAKGFAFDRVEGKVRFGNGSARSDGLTIDGPAAAIAIRGAADLRAQSYDQTIEVRPKAANVLTAVGALAAGPVGAAIGAAANAVLQKPLGSLTAKTYRVTGPWKEPKVEVLSREQTRAAAPGGGHAAGAR